ncbi:hypothetical protein [Methanotorris formicicus]|uniref:Uncharacterized protein n=1 Tax=Methanotorris formicicus Mc-S-70 TaxID=647171 RepID=H1L0P5_9EURY|nr:hypothetical protein [Methanotorris formicicus]EHP84589.1 hypothetical protein MetfoDRAFT_1619 [Methanotorris formicicus Mc-S-70]
MIEEDVKNLSFYRCYQWASSQLGVGYERIGPYVIKDIGGIGQPHP